MRRLNSFFIAFCCMVSVIQAQVTLTINPAERGALIGDRHYGIFFEEINHAGDGGLYAELIRNRSFEDNGSTEYWTATGGATLQHSTDNLLNDVQGGCAVVTMPAKGDAIENSGFWGMNIVSGEEYKLSMFVLCYETVNLKAVLLSESGETLGSSPITIQGDGSWQKVQTTITPTASNPKGRFALVSDNDAEVELALDVVSLFPPTYNGRENGCRRDLAEMLHAMKPAFMRFPGGCYIEGEYRNGSQNRFEWKKTIGPIENRPGHLNVNWNYRVSDGLGFHEMLQLSEDLGAEPLFVVNIGLGHGWYQPYYDLDEYIQEALDALEYANGDASTTYGAMRIANGHVAPFNLRLIEIGNENYNYTSYDNRDQSDHYAERYYAFCQAIKENYPDVTCIGNVQSWSTDDPTWRNSYPVDAVDEHYYRNPGWFVNQYAKYDAYDRSTSPKVYAGEYAVTSDFGTTGNLAAALGEAVYMEGMENNSDLCIMNSYAPIFVNENDQKWMPDMIRFNSSEAYGTPSYYVQKLMPNYVGKQNVKWTETGNTMSEGKNYGGLSTWLTSAQFSNYTVTRSDGTVYNAKFDGTEGWTSNGGAWSENEGTLTQSSTSMEGKVYLNTTEELGDSYTIELDAVKTGGNEGFLIAFNYKDSDNYVWWNLGGWNNSKHAVEVCESGAKKTVAERNGYLVTGQTYHIKIVVDGADVECFLDDELMHSFNVPVSQVRKVYVASSINDETGKLYVKMVNPNGEPYTTTLNLKDYHAEGGKLIQMKSDSKYDENTTDNKYNVVPQEQAIGIFGSTLTFTIPAYSFNIAELNVAAGEQTENSVSVMSGVYYLKADAGYMSRGGNWGTQMTLHKVGLPVSVKKDNNGNYRLRYLDYQNAYLGKDGSAYTDKSDNFPIAWQFKDAGVGKYVLYNVDAAEYLTYDGKGGVFTSDESEATVFELQSVEEHNRYISSLSVLESQVVGKPFKDVSDKLVNADMTTGTEGWEALSYRRRGDNESMMMGSMPTRAGVNEVYEYSCSLKQTVTGLMPNSLYRFSLQGFYRPGMNYDVADMYDNDYSPVNACIFAGNSFKPFANWASDRTSDVSPNTMEEAAACFADGRYQNSVVAYSDGDGNLTVGLDMQQFLGYGWLIWGSAKLEELQDFSSRIVNASFEQSLTEGWTNVGMQRQSNAEPNAMKQGLYYCESWVDANRYTLGNVSVSQTVMGLPDGDYRITATCHAENQNISNPVTGVYLYAGNEKTAVTSPGEYDVISTVIGGSLTIGFYTENTDANWVTVDNFRLIKVGESIDNYKKSLKASIQKLQTLLETKKILTDKHHSQADALIADAELAEEKEAIIAYTNSVNELYAMFLAYRIPVDRSNEGYAGYLFAYFPSNSDENLYYAYSEDGFNYIVLNNGQRVMASDTVAIKRGIRDPHILRGADGKTFYMVATDMMSAQGWSSNRGIVMYKSHDLIHWTHSTVHFPTRFPDGWSSVTRVWAPETIWDPDYLNADGTKGRYMVYFSLLTSDDGTCNYDKVYYCYANDDFTDLLDYPQFFYDRGSATIDADIVYDETDGLYHMIYKNEGSGGIMHVTAETLTPQDGKEPGSQWSKPTGSVQQTSVAVEGGGIFRTIADNQWVVMYDCYGSGYYQFCTTNDWKTYTLRAQTTMSGMFTPRHGSVTAITPREFNALLDAFPTEGLSKYIVGDVNSDGKVNSADAKMIADQYIGKNPPSFNRRVADVNDDRIISVADANAIVTSCK